MSHCIHECQTVEDLLICVAISFFETTRKNNRAALFGSNEFFFGTWQGPSSTPILAWIVHTSTLIWSVTASDLGLAKEYVICTVCLSNSFCPGHSAKKRTLRLTNIITFCSWYSLTRHGVNHKHTHNTWMLCVNSSVLNQNKISWDEAFSFDSFHIIWYFEATCRPPPLNT